MVSSPGKVWHYDNAATHLLSVILTKATGKETHRFAKEALFQPLGITGTEWSKMRDGYDDGSGLLSLHLHSADLVKIGRLILQKGIYNKQQIVSGKWINGLLQPDVSYPSYWGFEHSTYAQCFYHFTYKGTPITYGMGWGGQFLVVIPSQNAIIVINENTADANAIRQSDTFITKIFPVIFNYLASHTL